MALYLNDDFMVYVHHKHEEGYHPTTRKEAEEDARRYVRRYQGTQITDIFYNTNAQLSYSPSQVLETAESRFQKTEVDGIPVSFKDSYLATWHEIFTRLGVDLYEIFFEETRKIGIHPWLSLRLNDVHDSMTPTGELRGCDFTHAARKNGLVRCRHHDLRGYYDNALDFSLSEVKEHFLLYAREQILRYDAYGVDLDFMREPYCFMPGQEMAGAAHVREVVCRVRKYCDEAEAKFGHPVKLSLRTFRDPQSDHYSGIRAAALAKEGLLDLVIASPRWETIDSHIPTSLWRSILPQEVSLAVGTDNHYRGPSKAPHFATAEQLYGMANAALSAGADGLYLFNYTYFHTLEDPAAVVPLCKMGSLATLSEASRRNTVSYQDVASVGETCYRPLPCPLSWQFTYLPIPTGIMPQSGFLLLGTDLPPEELEIYLNSKTVSYLGKALVEEAYAAEPVLVFQAEALKNERQMLEIAARKPGILSFVEMRTQCPPLLS